MQGQALASETWGETVEVSEVVLVVAGLVVAGLLVVGLVVE